MGFDKDQIRILLNLSIVDGILSDSELKFIKKISHSSGISEETFESIKTEVLKEKDLVPVKELKLSDSQRFFFLVQVLKLMKSDGKIYLSEMKYCEEVAENLGYNKKVVKKLLPHIRSFEDVAEDLENIKKTADKFLK